MKKFLVTLLLLTAALFIPYSQALANPQNFVGTWHSTLAVAYPIAHGPEIDVVHTGVTLTISNVQPIGGGQYNVTFSRSAVNILIGGFNFTRPAQSTTLTFTYDSDAQGFWLGAGVHGFAIFHENTINVLTEGFYLQDNPTFEILEIYYHRLGDDDDSSGCNAGIGFGSLTLIAALWATRRRKQRKSA